MIIQWADFIDMPSCMIHSRADALYTKKEERKVREKTLTYKLQYI